MGLIMETITVDNKKENKMLRKIFIVIAVLMLAGSTYAQYATPTSYTSFLGLRNYAQGANPGADSLNANNNQIDNFAKASNDTMAAVKADVYSVISYSGGIIDGTVMWADMSTSAKSEIVQTTGTQSIAGTKTLTDYWFAEGFYPSADNTYRLGLYPSYRWNWVETRYLAAYQIVMRNSAGTDSAIVDYDGTKITFDKPVTVADFRITESISVDSATTFNSLKLYGDTYTPALVGDSILVIDTLQANIRIAPPGNMARVIGMSMEGASEGTIVILYNTSAIYSITLKDDIASGLYGENDHNLFKMAGDLVLAAMDNITFKYTYNDVELAFQWMEISRSDN